MTRSYFTDMLVELCSFVNRVGLLLTVSFVNPFISFAQTRIYKPYSFITIDSDAEFNNIMLT